MKSNRHFISGSDPTVNRTAIVEDRPAQLFGVFLLSIVCVSIFNRLFSKRLFPDSSFYEAQSPLLELFNAAFAFHIPLTIAGLSAATLLLLHFSYRFTWSALCSVQTRRFILLMAFLVVWRQATAAHNYFFDEHYQAERLILIASFILSLWRPAFLALLPPMVFILQGQLSVGFLSYTSAEFSMPLKVIVGFCSLMLVGLFSERRFEPAIIWMVVVVIMAHYWTAAYAKLLIDWHAFGQIHHMMSASYAGGWLTLLDTNTMSNLLQNLSRFDRVAMIITLLFESAVIFALFSGRLLVALLFVAAVFHFVVFVISGINFWQWLLIDLAFIYFLYMKSDKRYLSSSSLPLYTRITSLLVIAISPYWAGAPRLGWHDSPVNYIYQLRAIDADNNSTILMPVYFTPYEYSLNLNSISFLSESKTLPISWGATKHLSLAKTLANVSSSNDIHELIESEGEVRFDHERAQKFDQFINNFVVNKQANSGNKRWFDYMAAPLYLYTSFESRQSVDVPIIRVDIHRMTSWFDGTNFNTIDDDLVRTITVGIE